jgi:hypothetical protein
MQTNEMPILWQVVHSASARRTQLPAVRPAGVAARIGKQLASWFLDEDRANNWFWFSLFTCGGCCAARLIWLALT